ncbi:hypothetical protein FVEG_15888 [Fusarium verticillioides 7600]|uniref:Heterokaryon incompatibility domain-containing protein n=1 Tax=Gibberella moniliformis (strain M3125 / FGSC 7600) TaxID=334819 RepID=W7M4L3_GIBM7|nr:hypothetical protein FVEG_15888 [Fusarium verticillioides 7600]EWG45916.1 hypothetical protein FVEG_15888 [Fusarium verticillioides 7600]
MSDALVYHPVGVGHVRILRFGNRTSSGDISGNLIDINLEDAPPYFTLSYCWGTEPSDTEIQINDSLFHVSHSLAAAIRRLQELGSDDEAAVCDIDVKWVWIDKICINQNDPKERSQQVHLMGSIFSKAVRTLIWLGTDFDLCLPAWNLVDQIFDVFRRENPLANGIADIPFGIYSTTSHTAYGLPYWDDDLWKQLRRLLERPWFIRVWVIQEVVLSRDDPLILHGQKIYPWQRLAWVASWLRRSGYLRLDQVPNQMLNVDMISNIRRSKRPWNLDALLVATSVKTQATDPRDKVYGLLGLAAECQSPEEIPFELRVNYTLPVSQVYERVARFLLHKYQSLAILTRVRGLEGDICHKQRKHDLSMLPSWVPDWSDFTVPEREVAKSFSWIYHGQNSEPDKLGYPDHFKSSGNLVSKFKSAGRLALFVGIMADDIINAIPFGTSPGPAKMESPQEKSCMIAFLKLASSVEKNSDKDWIECFIRATTANQCQISGRSEEQLLRDGSAYILHLIRDAELEVSTWHHHNIISSLVSSSVGGDPSSYMTLARNFCFNRQFFVTSGHRMGIGPSGVRPGDCVAVIFGGGVPYAVRRRNEGFYFVGESYVHGLMNGEAIQAWKKGEFRLDSIDLY